ncbi:hypothetical protein BD770DRAFT_409655 [Pilaira anomala]|nr:hypothetical protein BD770DRAFT_409655 [Pilaira anomala]
MTNNLNNSLPGEIIKLIFQCLIKSRPYYLEEGPQEKEYLKTCLLVCKSWQRVAQEFFDSKISIRLTSKSSLERLSGDISYFGSNVKCITLNDCCWPEEYQTRFFHFYKILLECTSLETVVFLGKNNINEYLSRIVYGTKKLPSIKNLHIRHLELCEKRTRELYLHVNLQYHETITELSIASLKDLSRFEDFDDLFQLIAYFPNLTTFKLLGALNTYNDLTIDIHQLFKTAPQLQYLQLEGLKEVNCNSIDEETAEVLQNKILKHLRIETAVMDIKVLKYIVRGLEEYNDELYLDIKALLSDVLHPKNYMKQFENKLKAWTIRKYRSDIDYCYYGVWYSNIYQPQTYNTAQNFLNPEISINLKEKSLQSLLKDIPLFVTLKGSRYFFSEERKNTSFDFLDIFFMCPNLVSVNFQMEGAFDYFRALISNRKRRNSSADRFHNYSTPISELNLVCHTTITSLTIKSFEKLTTKYITYLEQLVAYFPSLTSFALSVNDINETMDIHELVETLPQLKELDLFMKEININSWTRRI